MSDSLCVVMPVYNEQDAIGAVLKKWTKTLDSIGVDYLIRAYNDGSRDDSLVVMRKIACNLRRVQICDKPNGGHGNTILTGYREAAKDGFDWIFQIDSDDEMGPEKFVELWNARGAYDFLVGTRDGRKQPWPRKIISFVSRCCVQLFYGSNTIWDVNTPYRLMRVSSFRDSYRMIPLTTFAPNVILSGIVATEGLRYYEIRVPQHDRTTGEVSIKKWKLLKAAAKSFVQTIAFSFVSSIQVTHGAAEKSLAWIAALIVAVSCFAFWSNPISNTGGMDSSVFAYIGDAMHRGLMPYRDVFDHKGPLIYLINYAGRSLGGGHVGVWVLEITLYILSIACMVKAMLHLFSVRATLLALILYVCFFIKFSEGGNFTEVYATDLIVIVSSLLFPDVLRGVLRRRTCMAAGLCAAAVLFLRPNMFGICIPVMIYVIERGVRFHWRSALISVKYGILGMMIVIGPILVWLYQNNLMCDMIDCYIKFNIDYMASYPAKLNFYLILIPVFGAANILAIIKTRGGMRKAFIYNLYFLIASSFLVAMKVRFNHYFLPLIPAGIMPVAWVIECLVLRNCGKLCLIAAGVFAGWVGYKSYVAMRIYCDSNNSVAALESKMDHNATTLVLGNRCNLYFLLGTRTASCYPYQPREGLSDRIDKEVNRIIESKIDKYIIVSKMSPLTRTELVRRYYEHVADAGDFALWRAK